MNQIIESMLRTNSLSSDQLNAAQIAKILEELELTLQRATSGAVVEFGCYIGTASLFIRRLLDAYQDNREFHVYDSFEGLPLKTAADASPAGSQFQAGELAVSKKQFLQEFRKAALRPPIVHKAWFADLGAADVPEQISFAFLDGDFYESIRDSLNLVLPRMVPNSTLIIDDYAREALPGVAKAVRDFAPQLLPKVNIMHNLGIILV